MSELRTSVVVDLAGNLARNSERYSKSLQQFSRKGSKYLNTLSTTAQRTGKMLDSMGGRYTAMLAGGLGAYQAKQMLNESAQLDKSLVQLAQTAGVSLNKIAPLRNYIYELSKQTGKTTTDLLRGLNALIQSGQSWQEALSTIGAINDTMSVTGVQSSVLANAMTVAAKIFDFDLSDPQMAVELLDKMTKAGRLGNAELDNLSSIFARVGGNAKGANLSFSETLGFIEQLSLIEKNPERLATLVDSTLRLFTNQKYLDNAQKVTGISFYNEAGERRAAFNVLDDIAAKYKTLKTDIDRDKAISEAFGQTDLDTIKGLRLLLSGDAINQAKVMSQTIYKSSGVIAADLTDALNNSIDQAARLKAALGEAADDFAQPINDAVSNAIKYLMDEKGLGGKEMIAGAAVGAAALLAGAKGGGLLLKKMGNLSAGVAKGKALEEVAGVTPVYVVNMPAGGIAGGIGNLTPAGRKPSRNPGRWNLLKAMPDMATIKMMGVGAIAAAGSYAGAAGLAGYGVGSLLNKNFIQGTEFSNNVGGAIATLLAKLGNEEAKSALNSTLNPAPEVNGTIKLEITDQRINVKELASTNSQVAIEVDTGQLLGDN